MFSCPQRLREVPKSQRPASFYKKKKKKASALSLLSKTAAADARPALLPCSVRAETSSAALLLLPSITSPTSSSSTPRCHSGQASPKHGLVAVRVSSDPGAPAASTGSAAAARLLPWHLLLPAWQKGPAGNHQPPLHTRARQCLPNLQTRHIHSGRKKENHRQFVRALADNSDRNVRSQGTAWGCRGNVIDSDRSLMTHPLPPRGQGYI